MARHATDPRPWSATLDTFFIVCICPSGYKGVILAVTEIINTGANVCHHTLIIIVIFCSIRYSIITQKTIDSSLCIIIWYIWRKGFTSLEWLSNFLNLLMIIIRCLSPQLILPFIYRYSHWSLNLHSLLLIQSIYNSGVLLFSFELAYKITTASSPSTECIPTAVAHHKLSWNLARELRVSLGCFIWVSLHIISHLILNI